jgi:hypothetical protein
MHTIRLRGPWQLEPLERIICLGDGQFRRTADVLPDSARATMPTDWSESFGSDFFGRVRYRRIFQKPTGLESGERVWLLIEPPRSHGVVELNRKRLGDVYWNGDAGRFDITELLEDHNHLEIVVAHPALDSATPAADDSSATLPGGLVGAVRLEIGNKFNHRDKEGTEKMQKKKFSM